MIRPPQSIRPSWSHGAQRPSSIPRLGGMANQARPSTFGKEVLTTATGALRQSWSSC